MEEWRIIGLGELPDVYVFETSYDEALAKARKVNPKYNGGKRAETDEELMKAAGEPPRCERTYITY